MPSYRNDPKFSDWQVWANSADPVLWSGSTLFAIPSASFGCNTLRKRHLVQLLGDNNKFSGVQNFKISMVYRWDNNQNMAYSGQEAELKTPNFLFISPNKRCGPTQVILLPVKWNFITLIPVWPREGKSIYLAYQFYWLSSMCLRNKSRDSCNALWQGGPPLCPKLPPSGPKMPFWACPF